ncbi:hybrid sensor histidine kinase/response regulator [Iodobacter ciconiae]|uniref:Chemotaxis protein CheA n=1 Tax=Iodobacter ciconiae TaxID=2496266 RepID=A0A3S8ZV90_9NEIS|nr:Hpt domain-containing protein [Iodobacter ciconiae]AZN37427.1 response regulator [Iodobacter ciconiae]
MSAHTEFDLGSLVWVKSEIEQTLQKASQALAQFDETRDSALLKHARTFLHQAHGAVQMVELTGLARFCEEIEQTLAADEISSDTLVVIQKAIVEASRYLEQIAVGGPNQPLRLLASFKKMAALRQASESGSELFFPQLAELSLPKGLPARALAAHELGPFVRARRLRFEAVLLSWMAQDKAAAGVMAKNLAEIAATQSLAISRHFWWAAAGLLDGLSHRQGQAEPDVDLKQLVLRLNMQLRRLSDGSGKVAERLYRDILYALLMLDTRSPLALALRKSFALESLLPGADSDLLSPASEFRRSLARNLLDELDACKEIWGRVSSGQFERLSAFIGAFEPLAQRAEPLAISGLDNLWSAVSSSVHGLNQQAPSDENALEVATALLLIDNCLAIYPLVAEDFPIQVEAMCQRLLNPSSKNEVPHLDEVTRQAQERLLQAQLAHEMRSNLQAVEDILDTWFRQPDNGSELSKINPSLHQVMGALLMLEKLQAAALLQACQQRIEQLTQSELLLPAQEELELLAEGLSCLGFYIESIAQNRDEPASLLIMIDKLTGTARIDAVESELEQLEVEPQLDATDHVLPVQAVIDPSRPLPATDEAVDAELLEVFLEEATEVLASIAEQILVCRRAPHDREALTVLRRSFHTLKGSGRMVGLNHIAQVAWAMEQLLSKLMQIEKAASLELLQLLTQAHTAFSGWVQQLSREGVAQVEGSDLIAVAEQLRVQLDTVASVPDESISVSQEGEQGASDEVVIGTVTVSASLFSLFCNEAAQYLLTLKGGKSSPPSSYLLAAHTLGGIASTAGFRSLGELAYTLEHAVQRLGEVVIGQEPVLDSAVARIGSMLESIFAREAPGFAEAEILALQSLQAKTYEISLDETPEVAAVELEMPESSICLPEQELAPELSLDEPTGIAEFETMLDLSVTAEDEFLVLHEEVEREAPAEDLTAECSTEVVKPEEPIEAFSSFDHLLDQQDEAERAETLGGQVEAVFDGSAFEPQADLPKFTAMDISESADESSSPLSSLLDQQAEDVDGGDAVSLLDVESLTPFEQLMDKHDVQRKSELDALQADDIDEQLLPVFIEEADELMQQISSSLRGLRLPDEVQKESGSLKRLLHTFKGSARMAGAMRMGEVAHQMESRLLAAGNHYSAALLDALDADFDLIQSLADELKGVKKPAPVVKSVVSAPVEVESGTTIRVKSELMDQLVNQAGEVSIARSRIEAEMITMKASLLDLTENVNRLRSQLREMEIQAESQMQAKIQDGHEANFDPLEFDRFTRLQEVTRFIAESVNDVATIQQNLLKNHDDSTGALMQQARMTKELQQSLMRVRMVPFSSLSDRLYRLTRQTGKEVGKKVNLELHGGGVEVDRGVLDQMMSPFEHMLRNAIDHGLESTEQRIALGKPEFGEVQVEVRQEGNELVLLLKDDGRGLDLESLKAKGVEKGLLSLQATDQMVTELIFEPGISTASSLTALSGRGIGMDVVKNKLSDLGGRIDVSSQAGVGTTFTIYLPLTLAVTQVVLVKAGGEQFAIPSGMIEQVQEIKLGVLERLYESRFQEWMDYRYPFAYLPRLLGDAVSVPEQKRYNTVMLLRSGTGRMALHVDELVRNQEVVVKTIGPQLVRIPGVTGATVLGNGDVVMIMNPLSLLARGETRTVAAQLVPEEFKTTSLVMVVDDSLTVRKITGRLLAREGFQVLTAKDGVDALQQLSDVIPDVMLVDIEMPRMDGFELTRNVRANEGTRQIPIIMITSRTADKHKNYAFELGVNAFLGKPYQEEELLDQIQRFIKS